MKKIDAHLHVAKVVAGYCWRGESRAIGNGKAQWGNGEIFDLLPKEFGDTSFVVERALEIMDDHDVEKAVLMHGSMYGFQNQYHLEIMKKYPSRFCPSCTVDPFMTNALETMTNYIEKEKFRLAKFEISSAGGLMGCHDPFSLIDDRMCAIYALLEKNGAILALDVGEETTHSHQPENLLKISEMFPKLKIVHCHLLFPNPQNLSESQKKWEMLKRTNVFFDISCLPKLVSAEPYPYTDIAKIVRTAMDVVGDKQLMWGSDTPYAAVNDSYTHLANYIEKSELFTKEELKNLYYNNANHLFFEENQ